VTRVSVRTLTIDDQHVTAREGETILAAAREAGIDVPALCHLDGVGEGAACRLCLVEIDGSPKLQAACVTVVAEGMVVRTATERLAKYRRMTLELFFAERNHVCAVCVANRHCELQDLAVKLGMDHVRFDYLSPKCDVDVTHRLFGIDHNRCILCTRCVRTCDEIEGAHTWDVMGRGTESRIIADMGQPWGESVTCTSCGKCVQACPTGALFRKGVTVEEMTRDRRRLGLLVVQREKREWHV
jgi:bidirectional [NiFe] hydrogenase diaphorase subunit